MDKSSLRATLPHLSHINSWNLLRHLLLAEGRIETSPVFQREIGRPPIWQRAATWMSRATGALLVSSGLVCYFSVLLVFYMKNLLILLIPLLGSWSLIVILTVAPLIAEERAQQTWDLLRTTPLGVSDLLLSKTGGALWWLRDMLRLLMSGLVVIAMIIATLSFVLSSINMSESSAQLPLTVTCMAGLLLPIVTASLFMADRTQFFVLTVLAALAASATTRNVRNAISGGLAATFVVWLVDLVFVGIAFQLYNETDVVWNLLSAGALGPVVGFMGVLKIKELILASAVTLGAREVLVYSLWRWTLHAARQQI